MSIQDVLEGAINNVNNAIANDTDVIQAKGDLETAVTNLVTTVAAESSAADMVTALGYASRTNFNEANGPNAADVLFAALKNSDQDIADAAKAALAAAIVKGEMVADETAGNVKSGIESKIDAVNDAIA
ncbi:MAG: hypothetical protein LBP75_08375, partial [Planctomycetota bacterium]|nr:hypothetical protein [Planctomycetota bacterium]